jgi:hypothetical protein
MDDSSSEVDEQRQMRQVLLRQRNLMGRMRAQLDLAAGRRAHLVGLLQRLWARLAERPSAEVSGGVRTSRQLDDQLRAVCVEVGEQADDSAAPTIGADVPDSTAQTSASLRHA